MKKTLMFVTVVALASTLLAGCSLSGAPTAPLGQTAPGSTAPSGQNLPTSATGFGAIEVRITDAPKYGVEHVVVNFSQVSVHKAGDDAGKEDEGGWIDITLDDESFDLVELAEDPEEGKERVEALLAHDGYVPAGKYTQIRVIIDEEQPVTVTYTDPEHLVDGEPQEYTVDAKLPSGVLKFVQPFDVVDSTTTIITIDFDVEKSVVFTGANTKGSEVKVIVKPVVKLSVEHESLSGTIAGTVTDSSSDEPIEGATIVVEGTTLSATTDAEGKYTISGIPVGAGMATYTVTASAEGYDDASEEDVEVSADTTSTVNFELEPEGP